MNCFLFRQSIRLTPREWPAQSREHIEYCLHCKAFAKKRFASKQELEAALRISVDPSLAYRILLSHHLRPNYSLRRFVFAASVAVPFVLSLGLRYP